MSIAWLWSPCLGAFCNNNRLTVHYALHKLNFHYIKLLLKLQMTTRQNKNLWNGFVQMMLPDKGFQCTKLECIVTAGQWFDGHTTVQTIRLSLILTDLAISDKVTAEYIRYCVLVRLSVMIVFNADDNKNMSKMFTDNFRNEQCHFNY